jgi:hypothetical protein
MSEPDPDPAAMSVAVLIEFAGTLLVAGQEAQRAGDNQRSVGLLRDCVAAGRELVRRENGGSSYAIGLAVSLYSLGAALNGARRYDAAIHALDEAEALYRGLVFGPANETGTSGGPETLSPESLVTTGLGLLAADVRLRRARSHAHLGAGVSAVADAQFAVMSYDLAARRGYLQPPYLELARVLCMAADIFGGFADLELALACAAAGLGLTVRAVNEFGFELDWAGHSAMVFAAEVELTVHQALGDLVAAENARGLLRYLDVTGPVADLTRARLLGRGADDVPGAARAAARRTAEQSAGQAPARAMGLGRFAHLNEEAPPCAPGLRAEDDNRLAIGVAAAEGALTLLESGDGEAGSRLGIEAYWILDAVREGFVSPTVDESDPIELDRSPTELAAERVRQLIPQLVGQLAGHPHQPGSAELVGDLTARLGRWGR